MTVPTLNSAAEFSTNGVTTNFPFFFKFLANEDLVVTYVDPSGISSTLIYGSQYTVNGAGDEDGGSVVTSTALAGPGQLIVSREMEAYQQTSLRNQGKFLAETHEDVFDRLTMLIQQGFSIFSRALTRPFGRDYFFAENRRIASVKDPVEDQDAATKKSVEVYVAGILETGQGPINNAANIIYIDGDNVATTVQKGVIKQFSSAAAVRGRQGDRHGEQATILGYYLDSPGVGGGTIYWDSSSTETDNGGSVFQVTGVPVGRWKRNVSSGVWAEWFGARNDGTDAAGTTLSVWAAIRSMRTNETSLIQYISGPTITAYKSGVLHFGKGVFAVSPDSFELTQDLGLKMVGQGSRGKNQAIPASTTLLFVGASSGFAIRHYGNGARSLTIETMDVCYQDSSFTGDLVDSLSSPGLRIANARLGCYGGFSGTRVQTARSLVRSTYDEFMRFENVVFDGAQDGWWSDNGRSLGGSIFGGWGTTFTGCTFYDIANRGMTHDLTRSRSVVNVTGCAFNPINVDPVRSIDLENIEGLAVEGNQFTPSTTRLPTAEWVRVRGSTGRLSENTFSGATAKVGTLGGGDPSLIDWSNNRISCSDGITIAGGVITGSGNEYSNATNGVLVSPTATVSLDIGPDIFKSGVNLSYSIPADSAFLGGRINYSPEQDSSNSRLSNTSTRITVRCTDERIVTIAALPSTGSNLASGRTYNVTAAGTFTLPTPSPGSRLRVMKSTATALTIVTTGGSNFTVGATGTRTSAVATAAELGAGMEFVAISNTSWIGQVLSGAWTFT